MMTANYGGFLRTQLGSRIVVCLLLIGALISGGVGALNGIHRSQDFQWSGERIFLQHSDPWAEYLRGDPHHQFIDTQIPNYLPILNILIVPLGMLPLAKAKVFWVFCNLSFAAVSGLITATFYGFRGLGKVAVVSLFFIATPTRVSIGNGQQSLLVLFIWCLALMGPVLTASRAGLAGISYFKFTFGPPLFLYVLFRRGVLAALGTLVPAMLAVGIAWEWITRGHDPGELLRLCWEPLQTAQRGYSASVHDPNLMNVLEMFLQGHLTIAEMNGVEIITALTVCVVLCYMTFSMHRQSSTQWHLAILATLSFVIFKHHSYDAVMLLLPLCYALRFWHLGRARIVLLLLGYLLYLQRIVEAVHLHPQPMVYLEFAMLLVVLGLIYRLHSAEQGTPVEGRPVWPPASLGARRA